MFITGKLTAVVDDYDDYHDDNGSSHAFAKAQCVDNI